MKAIVCAAALFFGSLFWLTTFVPSSAAQREAEKYFAPAEIERGGQFSLQKRLLFWGGIGLHLGLFTLLVCSGFARRLADRCLLWTRGRWLLVVLLVGSFCFLAEEAITLPLGLVRLETLRAWGMTQRPVPDWLADHALGLGVSAAMEGLVLIGLYLLLRFFPRGWWLLASLGGMLLGAAFAFLLPVLIAPLFNTFTPLERTRWAHLQPAVQDLTRRAEIPVREILVMDASRQGSHTNAYFTGFGSTRRIVLFDTLLEAHSRLRPEAAAAGLGLLSPAQGPLLGISFFQAHLALGQYEIESVLGHEMGHWRHEHIVKGIGLATVGAFFGLYVLARILRRAVGRGPLWLQSPADPAGIPLIWLLMTVGSWLAAPLENAVSRHFERQADQAALELTQRPEAFIACEKRLARDNISNVAPNPWSVWLFASHPPTVERIRRAEQWQAGEKKSQAGK